MKKILIKEITKDNTSEYLIYVMIWPEKKIISAYTETNKVNMELRLNEIFINEFMSDESLNNIKLEDILIKE